MSKHRNFQWVSHKCIILHWPRTYTHAGGSTDNCLNMVQVHGPDSSSGLCGRTDNSVCREKKARTSIDDRYLPRGVGQSSALFFFFWSWRFRLEIHVDGLCVLFWHFDYEDGDVLCWTVATFSIISSSCLASGTDHKSGECRFLSFLFLRGRGGGGGTKTTVHRKHSRQILRFLCQNWLTTRGKWQLWCCQWNEVCLLHFPMYILVSTYRFIYLLNVYV